MQCYTSAVWMHKPDWYRFISLLIAVIILALDASSIIASPYAPTKHGVLLAASIVSIITLVYRLVGQRYFSSVTKSYPWIWITPPLEALAVLLLLSGFILVTIGVLSPDGGSCSAPPPLLATTPSSSFTPVVRPTALPDRTTSVTSSTTPTPTPIVVPGDDTDDEDELAVSTASPAPATVVTAPVLSVASTPAASPAPTQDVDDTDDDNTAASAPSAPSAPVTSPLAPITATPANPTPTTAAAADDDDADDLDDTTDSDKRLARRLPYPRDLRSNRLLAVRSLHPRQSQADADSDTEDNNSRCSIDASVIALSVTLFISMIFSFCTAVREARRITAARRQGFGTAGADGSVAEKAPLEGVGKVGEEDEGSVASSGVSKGSEWMRKAGRFGYVLVKGR